MEGFGINYVIFSKRLKEAGNRLFSLSQEISGLAEYVRNLDIFWNGDANNAYRIKVFGDIARMGECIEEVIELVTLCDEAVKAYQETEKVIAQMIGGFRIEKQK